MGNKWEKKFYILKGCMEVGYGGVKLGKREKASKE
jgi:hypothetical protein